MNFDVESSIENIARYLDALDVDLTAGIRIPRRELAQISEDDQYALDEGANADEIPQEGRISEIECSSKENEPSNEDTQRRVY